ncbi:pilin [Alkalimarinus alittae]|uniref:Pilin n=2 Tax=Alkalimarinus alittae TaxID=2961619 RepID=A0ABY6N7H0_9ALTE|nr:pilin [Alkalimarinus alittae]
MKAPINDYYANNGTVPSVSQLGTTEVGKYVSSITILTSSTNIIVRATFTASGASPRIQGKTISIATQDRGRSWGCGQSSVLSGTETTVDISYLPLGCNR